MSNAKEIFLTEQRGHRLMLCALCSVLCALCGCSKTDPVLPGQRTSIFGGSALTFHETSVPNLPDEMPSQQSGACMCTIDSSNVIWIGERKLFSGFATDSYVKCEKQPVCDGDFVYAGLSTGELVKVNQRTRNVAWVADIYKDSNMLGGASVLDIVAPIVVTKTDVYAGGLGDAFCRVNKSNGSKRWCLDIGTDTAFIVMDSVIYMVSTGDNLYAINPADGGIYWHSDVNKRVAPTYKNKIVTVGKEKFNAENGKKI